jgi:hypothetical protein
MVTQRKIELGGNVHGPLGRGFNNCEALPEKMARLVQNFQPAQLDGPVRPIHRGQLRSLLHKRIAEVHLPHASFRWHYGPVKFVRVERCDADYEVAIPLRIPSNRGFDV